MLTFFKLRDFKVSHLKFGSGKSLGRKAHIFFSTPMGQLNFTNVLFVFMLLS